MLFSSMRAASQIAVYLSTFLFLLLLGILLDTAFWQASIQAEQFLGTLDRLPRISDLFMSNTRLPLYLLLYPWLAFAGTPLIRRKWASDFWDPMSFVLRFTAFCCVEALLLFVMFTR